MTDPGLSLTALAEWVRSLPVASLAPVGVLLVAGLLLLCFGQRLLKPVLVLVSIFVGVMVCARVGQAMQSSIPTIAWSAFGAIAGLFVAVLSYRLILGLAMGLIGAAVAILLSLTAVQLGWIDVTSKPPPLRADGDVANEVVTAFESLTVDRIPLALATIQSETSPQADPDAAPVGDTAGREAVARELDAVSPGLGQGFLAWLDRVNGLVGSAGTWFSERWTAMPKPMQTLLTASAAMGGFLRFVAGAGCPAWAAAVLTSLLGSLLVLLCGAPIVSRILSADSLPDMRPLGWLCLWLAIALAGSVFQWVTRPKKQAAKREPAAKTEAA